MKLLAINGYYKPATVYGGPIRSESTLFEQLVKLGVDVTVITTDANGKNKLDVPLFTPVTIEGVKVIYCPTNPIPGYRFFSASQIKISKIFIQSSDLVDLQTLWGPASHPLSVFCNNKKVPYYISLRGSLIDFAVNQSGLLKRLKKMLFLYLIGYAYYNNAVALHCTSDLEKDNLESHPITTPTFTVPNCVDIEKFSKLPERGILRKKYQISDNALVMIMIGRLSKEKNPMQGVNVLIAAQELSAPIHLIVVGPDQNKFTSLMTNAAQKCGCHNRLHFTGLLEDNQLLQAMADSDLFIMPSYSENFGMSAAEAMAAGLPILVSDKVPVGTWAKEAGAGEIASCSTDEFSIAAKKMLSNPKKLKQMGEIGKKTATELFNNENVAKRMLNELTSIVSQR